MKENWKWLQQLQKMQQFNKDCVRLYVKPKILYYNTIIKKH